MKPKLVMTLLVRDEEDIIENNICFHLNNGVDYIVAADHNSTDNTPKILEKYSKKGVLSYQLIKKHTWEQSKWVSMLAKKAVNKYGATHLFHCDADEFWYPISGNLKTTLPKKGEIFYVPVINYLPEMFIWPWTRKRMIVVNPPKFEANIGPDRSYRVFRYSYPMKIMTTSEFINIAPGNHDINDKKLHKKNHMMNINIHHFPIRSYKQFVRRVVNGGLAYANNPINNPNNGWHKKEWYLFYKAGLIRDVYKQTCINFSERKLLAYFKAIKEIKIPRKITHAKIIYDFNSIKHKFKNNPL